MRSDRDLKNILERIDHRGYPAYKDTKGEYQFSKYVLDIEHVQGDPFAAPSQIRISVSGKVAGIPSKYYDKKHKRIATQDYLLRKIGSEIAKNSKQRGSGKSGMMHISRCGQEVLERTACQINDIDGEITVRLEVGFPANGRTINAGELERILFHILPDVVNKSLLYKNIDIAELDDVMRLTENQFFIRNEMKNRELTAFIADNSILPRKSGISAEPLKDAVRFRAPESMKIKMDLPDGTAIYGMGIPKGVTLIVGGGYHGKSTLLEALQMGVYDHIAGDGREYVFSDVSSVKIRAEDGRSISQTDISMFINNLPNKLDTRCFSTQNASGSTSQAANVIEAVETGCKVLLIDEDTSATNFMIRDELMQLVVTKDKEPITPYIDRVRELYESYGVSTILVAGSSGEYFNKADKIIQMDEYHTFDITEYAKDIAQKHGYHAKKSVEKDVVMPDFNRCARVNRDWIGEWAKIKVNGKDAVSINRDSVDTRYLEQLADEEQLRMIGYLFVYMNQSIFGKNNTLQDSVEKLVQTLEKNGLKVIFQNKNIPCNLAIPRKQELFMCINRFRKLI
ncbi:MAG: ABC-ATPase domain-containing protein [Lachnospiraceae bacterium]|nr:ABC-ATPase domain-containing protein [Lachnospiraceae bacterium]